MNAEQSVTAEVVAEHLNVSVETVYRMARQGQVPAVKVRRVWRFNLADVKAALEAPKPSWSQPARSRARRRVA